MTIFVFAAVAKLLAVVSSAPSIVETESVKVSRLNACELLRDPRLKLKVDQVPLPRSS